MKLRSTTPASINLPGKMLLVLSILVIAVAVPIKMLNQPVLADEYDDRINSLQQEINSYNAEAARLATEAKTLESAVAELQSQANVIQAQVDISQAKYDKLVAEIAETEKKIINNQDALGITIANLYVDDKISPIEMIASSSNISEFLDKQEYRNSVRDQLTSIISRIKDLKKQLSLQKADVEIALSNQKNAKNALVEKQNEKQALINETKGQESLYQELSAKTELERQKVAQEQQAAIRAAQNRGGTSTGIQDGSKGNYPWGGNGCYVSNDLNSYGGADGTGADPLGYACRQCTSYASWKIMEKTGQGYSYWGNANNWPNRWSNKGSTAHANSVGVITSGTYGHVVWVETEPDAQGYIIISQYNSFYDNTGDNSGIGWGNYSKVRVHQSTYNVFLYF